MEAKNFRSRARANLAGNWGVSIAIAAVASLLGGLIYGTSFLPSLHAETGVVLPFLQEIADNLTLNLTVSIIGFAAFIIGGVLQLGYAGFLLKQHDGKEFRFDDLFSQFDRFGTGFAQRFLRGLYVFLWSLLLIIPGIVKDYAYSMTPFILAENPNMSASEAMRASEELMDGYKFDLMVLRVTFLGWDLLAALTLNLGNLALNPYKNAAYAAFYREIQAEARYTSYE